MSRSYKYPVFKDHGNREVKRQANKVVRKYLDIIGGKFYRKLFDPWNICDWKWYPDKLDKIKESMRK